jgi:hypothetical protein
MRKKHAGFANPSLVYSVFYKTLVRQPLKGTTRINPGLLFPDQETLVKILAAVLNAATQNRPDMN